MLLLTVGLRPVIDYQDSHLSVKTEGDTTSYSGSLKYSGKDVSFTVFPNGAVEYSCDGSGGLRFLCRDRDHRRIKEERITTMRVMAIDYGDRRIGIAVSDMSGILCGEAFIIHEWDMERAAVRIAEEVKGRDVGTLVLGLPKNMDGSEGPRAELSRRFAALLKEHTGMEPVLWDERRSSIEAHAILHANGRKMKDHRKNVDAVAASLLLEGYLGSL